MTKELPLRCYHT